VVVSAVVLAGLAGSRIHTPSQSNKATDWGKGGGIGKIEKMSVGK
jgi:hypothetical protein